MVCSTCTELCTKPTTGHYTLCDSLDARNACWWRSVVRRCELATALATLAETPPRATPARETWATAIRDAARFAAGYRWRMVWGMALTCALLAALFWGLGQIYPHVFLTEWAYETGVFGIETGAMALQRRRVTPLAAARRRRARRGE